MKTWTEADFLKFTVQQADLNEKTILYPGLIRQVEFEAGKERAYADAHEMIDAWARKARVI